MKIYEVLYDCASASAYFRKRRDDMKFAAERESIDDDDPEVLVYSMNVKVGAETLLNVLNVVSWASDRRLIYRTSAAKREAQP